MACPQYCWIRWGGGCCSLFFLLHLSYFCIPFEQNISCSSTCGIKTIVKMLFFVLSLFFMLPTFSSNYLLKFFSLQIEIEGTENSVQWETRQCIAQHGIPIALEFIYNSENETQLNRKTCSQMGIHNCFVVWITYIRILISPFTIDSLKS